MGQGNIKQQRGSVEPVLEKPQLETKDKNPKSEKEVLDEFNDIEDDSVKPFELPPSPKGDSISVKQSDLKKRGGTHKKRKHGPHKHMRANNASPMVSPASSPLSSPKSLLSSKTSLRAKTNGSSKEEVEIKNKVKKSKHELARDRFFAELPTLIRACFVGSRSQQLDIALLYEEVLLDDDCQVALVEAPNGIDSVFSLFRSEDNRVLVPVSRCVAYLATISDHVRSEMQVRDVLDRAIALLARGSKVDYRLTANCVAAIANMCYTKTILNFVVDTYEAVPIVLELVRHKKEDVQEQAARCLAFIVSQGQYYRDKLLALKCVPIFSHAILHTNEARVLYQINRVVAQLTADQQVALAFFKRELCPRLFHVIQHAEEMPRLESMKIIANFSQLEDHKEEIFDLGMETMINVVQFASKDVKIHGLRALSFLTETATCRTSEDIEDQLEEEQHFRAELNNILRDMARRLLTDPLFSVFINCSSEDTVPDAYLAIGYKPFRTPIDLHVIAKRVDEWYYSNVHSFQNDVNLIVETVRMSSPNADEDPFNLVAKSDALAFLVDSMIARLASEQPRLLHITSNYKKRLQLRRDLEAFRIELIESGAISFIPLFLVSDEELLYWNARVLANCVVPEENHARIIRGGELEPVKRVLRFHDREDTLIEVLRFLGNLAYLDEAKEQFPKLGFIDDILKFARREEATLQRYAMRSLAVLSDFHSTRTAIREAHGIQTIASAALFGDEWVRFEAIRCLATLAEDNDSQHIILEAGVIPVVLLVAQSPNFAHRWHACRLLSTFAAKEQHRETLVLLGTVPIMVKTCAEASGKNPVHGYECAICQRPFECVRSATLALFYLSQEQKLVPDLVAAQAHEVLLPLAIECDDQWIRQYALAALSNTLYTAELKSWFDAHDGVCRILELTLHHNKQVAGRAMGVLATCAELETVRKNIFEEGGLERAIEVLNDPSFSLTIDDMMPATAKAECARLLAEMCHVQEYADILDEGGGYASLALLIERSDDFHVQSCAARCINVIAGLGEYYALKFAHDLEVLLPLVALASSKVTIVHREAAAAISSLALCDENKELIVDCGAVPPLIQLTTSKDTSIQAIAAEAIQRLAQQKENRAILGDSQAIRPMVNLLRSKSSDVRKQAVEALLNLGLRNPDNQYGMFIEGALDRAMVLVQDSDDGVRRLAYDLISRMAENEMIKGKLIDRGEFGPILVMADAPSIEARRHCSSILLRLCDEKQHRGLLFSQGIGYASSRLASCTDAIVSGNGMKLMYAFSLDEDLVQKFVIDCFTHVECDELLRITKADNNVALRKPQRYGLTHRDLEEAGRQRRQRARRRTSIAQVVQNQGQERHLEESGLAKCLVVPERFSSTIFVLWIYAALPYLTCSVPTLQKQSLSFFAVFSRKMTSPQADMTAFAHHLDLVGRLLHCLRSTDASTKALALHVLANLCHASRAFCTAVVRHKRFRLVPRCLAIYDKLLRCASPAKTWVDWECCRLLKNCSRVDDLQPMLCAYPSLLLSLTRVLSNPNVTSKAEGLVALANLAEDPNNKNFLGENRSLLAAVVNLILSTTERPDVHFGALQTLATLMINPENVGRMLAAVTDTVIVSRLVDHCESPDLYSMRYACTCLGHVTQHSLMKEVLFREPRYCSSTCLALLKVKDQLTSIGCVRTLGNLCMNERIRDSLVSDTTWKQNVAVGITDLLATEAVELGSELCRTLSYLLLDQRFVDSLVRVGGSRLLVEKAALSEKDLHDHAVLRLVSNALRAFHAIFKSSSRVEGIMPATCRAVLTARSDMVIQFWAAKSLALISGTRAERNLIRRTGGFQLLSVLSHTQYPEVAHYAATMAIDQITTIDDALDFHRTGGIEGLSHFLVHDDEGLIDECVHVVAICSENPQVVSDLLALSVVDTLVFLLDMQTTIGTVSQFSLKVLADCALCEALEAVIVDTHVIEKAMRFVTEKEKHFESARESLRLIANLAFRPDAQTILYRLNVLEPLLNILKSADNNADTEELQKYALIIVSYLSFDSGFKPQIAKLTISTVRRFLDHPDNAVASYAAAILSNLVEEPSLLKHVQSVRPFLASFKRLVLAKVAIAVKSLANLSGAMDLEEEALKVNIIGSLGIALSHFCNAEERNMEAIDDTCRALANLTVLTTENKNACIRLNIHQTLLSLVESREAARALAMIADSDANAKLLAVSGGLKVLLQLLKSPFREMRLLAAKGLAPMMYSHAAESIEDLTAASDVFHDSIVAGDEELCYWLAKLLKGVLLPIALEWLPQCILTLSRSIRCVHSSVDALFVHRHSIAMQVKKPESATQLMVALSRNVLSHHLSVQLQTIAAVQALARHARFHKGLVDVGIVRDIVELIYTPLKQVSVAALSFIEEFLQSGEMWATGLIFRLDVIPFLVDMDKKEPLSIPNRILTLLGRNQEAQIAILEYGGFAALENTTTPAAIMKMTPYPVDNSSESLKGFTRFKGAVRRIIAWNRMGMQRHSPVHPPSCQFFGTCLGGSCAGNKIEIFVMLKDRLERTYSADPGNLTVTIRNQADSTTSNSLTIALEQADVGLYKAVVSELLCRVGRYTVSVMIGTEHVSNSPYTFDISPGPIDPTACKIHPQELATNTVVAGHTAEFSIEARDSHNNKLFGGSQGLEVRMLYYGNRSKRLRKGVLCADDYAKCVIKDPDDGFLRGMIDCRRAGFYELRVNKGAIEFPGSPLIFECLPARVDVSQCSVPVSNREATVPAGWTSTIRICTKDTFGNELLTGGLRVECFGIIQETQENEMFETKDDADGNYFVHLRPSLAGIMTIHIRVCGTDVPGTPLQTRVFPGPPSMLHFIALGPGIRRARVGIKNRFIVRARDKFGNTLHESYIPIQVEIRDAIQNVVEDVATVKTRGDGIYRVEYEVAALKPYTVWIMCDGIATLQSPIRLQGVIIGR